MAPICQRYKWMDKNFTITIQYQFCENPFKSQDIKTHEAHCLRDQGKEQQHIQSMKEYKEALEQGMSTTQYYLLSLQNQAQLQHTLCTLAQKLAPHQYQLIWT